MMDEIQDTRAPPASSVRGANGRPLRETRVAASGSATSIPKNERYRVLLSKLNS